MYKMVPYCSQYGMGKIQKLPYSFWNELKWVKSDYEMASFCLKKWDFIKSFLGSADSNNILKRNKITPASFKYIYGIISSAILRAGGSNTMDWLYFATNNSQKEDVYFHKVAIDKRNLVFNLPDLERGFQLSDVYLSLGKSFSENIRQTALLINEILCQPYLNSLDINGYETYEQLYHKLISVIDIDKKSLCTNRIGKLVTKVDFVLEKFGEKTIPVFVDANDLHGGLQWINDFNYVYQKYSNDQLLLDNNDSIVEKFVETYLNAFYTVKGVYPKKVLICLNDEKRWNQDNGYNYKCIKNAFSYALSQHYKDYDVEITYMKYYLESINYLNETSNLRTRVIDNNGRIKLDYYFYDYELVVRNYMKLTNDPQEGGFFFTDQIIKDEFKNKFLILEEERTRLLYDKRYVLTSINNRRNKNVLDDICVTPRLIGIYSLKQTPDVICNQIVEDAFRNNISEIVLKFSDKSIIIDTTAYFFNLKNEKHYELLFYTITKLKENLKDVEHITVESLIGRDYYNDRKVELRFLIFNNVEN